MRPAWVYRLDEVIQVAAKTRQGDRLEQGWIGFQQGVRGIGRWDAVG